MWDGHATLDRHLLWDQDDAAYSPALFDIRPHAVRGPSPDAPCGYCGRPQFDEQGKQHLCWGAFTPGNTIKLEDDVYVLILERDKDKIIYSEIDSPSTFTKTEKEFLAQIPS